MPGYVPDGWRDSRIAEGAEIRKIIIHCDSSAWVGIYQFFDADGNLLLEAGNKKCEIKKEVELKEGERLLAIKGGFRFPDRKNTPVDDVQLVIGWLD